MPEISENDDITTISSSQLDLGARPTVNFRFGHDAEGEPRDYTARCPKGLAWTDASVLFETQRSITAAQRTLDEAVKTSTNLDLNARAILQATLANAPTPQHMWLVLVEGETEVTPEGRERKRGGFLRRALADEQAWSDILDSLEDDEDPEADIITLIDIALMVYNEFEPYMAERWNRLGMRAPVSAPERPEAAPKPKTVARPKAAPKKVGPKKPANARR